MATGKAVGMHHAYAIEAGEGEGVEQALGWVERELGMSGAGNPDIVVLRYGLFTVEEARGVGEVAAAGPVAGEHKVIIIAASRAYREAQNALLKLFEEPPPGTYLFLVLPTLGGLLPTLRSRLQILPSEKVVRTIVYTTVYTTPEAEAFMRGTREQRSALVKKLATGRDEEERRAHRDTALAIVNGIEAAAYATSKESGFTRPRIELLEEVQALRGYLHERSAPVRMILEHLAIVTPRHLVS